MIYLFHGFGSSAKESLTIQTLMANIQSNSGLGICPITYSSTDPNHAYHTISNIISEDDDDKIFIGVSLGGFWARYFANQHPNSKLIMINPALDAPYQLSTMKGQTLAGVKITDEIVDGLDPYIVYKDHNNLSISVILCDDDNIILPNQAFDLYVDRGDVLMTSGGHRVELTTKHISFINKAINNIAG